MPHNIQLTTPVEIKKSTFDIDHRSNILLLGSCFAQNMGLRLQGYKYSICCNPFGIIYNPLSIATALKRVLSGQMFNEESSEVFESAERWHSTMHHSDFSRKTKEELLATINSTLQQAHLQMKQADVVIITFGTAYAYEQKSDGRVVSNCHKLPASTFNRRLLSIEEIVREMSEPVKDIISLRPEVKIIFTVSPIRHLRDGAHDNQKSKATLLLAIEELQKAFPQHTHYFPAYEIMLDELRDYRFYADDMTHPSPLAVEYIWEKFATSHIAPASLKLNEEIEEIKRALAHRPFDAESKAYKKFIGDVEKKIANIREKNPHLDFDKETEQCNTLLNR